MTSDSESNSDSPLDAAPLSRPPSLPPLPSLPSSQLLRLLLTGFLILLLQIPMMMVRDVIPERQAEQQNAIQGIDRSWGESQIIEGPRLVVPCEHSWVEKRLSKDVILSEIRYAHFLPETLDIRGELKSESRYRGIFEVPVYRAELRFQEEFKAPDFDGLVVLSEEEKNQTSSTVPGKILWDQAHLVVTASDARAIQNAAQMN